MARYQRRQPYPPGACYALFQHALEHRDAEAWAALYAQYQRLVRRQLGNAPGEPDALVNQAFERLWRAIPPERFGDFPTLDKLLAYLKRCAQSVALDARRQEEREKIRASAWHTHPETHSEIGTAPADYVLDEIVGGQIFAHARKRLIGPQERLVFRASLEWNLKPTAIATRWPALFADAHEVSRIKERIFRRLRRDVELRALLGIVDADGGKS